MKLSRRIFLSGAISAAVIAVAAKPGLVAVPVIYGDGIHDDTEALQALIDGKPVRVGSDSFIAKSGHIKGGKFRLSKPLDVSRIQGWHFEHMTVIPDDSLLVEVTPHRRAYQLFKV